MKILKKILKIIMYIIVVLIVVLMVLISLWIAIIKTSDIQANGLVRSVTSIDVCTGEVLKDYQLFSMSILILPKFPPLVESDSHDLYFVDMYVPAMAFGGKIGDGLNVTKIYTSRYPFQGKAGDPIELKLSEFEFEAFKGKTGDRIELKLSRLGYEAFRGRKLLELFKQFGWLTPKAYSLLVQEQLRAWRSDMTKTTKYYDYPWEFSTQDLWERIFTSSHSPFHNSEKIQRIIEARLKREIMLKSRTDQKEEPP